MSEKVLKRDSHHDPMTDSQWAIQIVQWVLKYAVILCLSFLLAIGLLQLAQGIFQVIEYYWLSKIPHLYPINLEALSWGIKLIALFLVSIWLLSQYRANFTSKAIVQRSVITGAVLGVLFTGMLATDFFATYYSYNTKQITCQPPKLPQNLR